MKSKLKNLLAAGGLSALLFSGCSNKEEIPYFPKEVKNVSLTKYHSDEEYQKRCLEFKNYISSNKFIKNVKKFYPKKRELVIPSSAKYIAPGGIKYNKGPLYSNGFHHCSVVILDYGKDAFLAHVYPQCWWGDEKIMCYENVVDELIKKSKEKNLNPKKSFAIVHSKNEDDLRRISYDLKINNIPIKTAHILAPELIDSRYDPECLPYGLSEDINRDILYFPKNDSLCISWSNSCEGMKKFVLENKKKMQNNK